MQMMFGVFGNSAMMGVRSSMMAPMRPGIFGGAQMMMGMPMGGGFGMMAGGPAAMMFQMMEQMLMMQQMQQMSSQSGAYSGPPAGYAPQSPGMNYGYNPATGLSYGYQLNGQSGGTLSPNPGFGPQINPVPNMGAGTRYPEFQQMRDQARQQGSLDGTFITPHTSLEQDQANLNRLNDLVQRGSDDELNLIKQASPQEHEALKAQEEKLDAQLAELDRRGVHLDGNEKQLMQTEGIEKLYREGKLNSKLGEQNRANMEMLMMSGRAEANEFVKFNVPVPDSMPRDYIEESPFNPQRQARPHSTDQVPTGVVTGGPAPFELSV